MSCVKNEEAELGFAEQPSFSAPVAQNGFRDAENDDDTDDKEDCGVFHAPSVYHLFFAPTRNLLQNRLQIDKFT